MSPIMKSIENARGAIQIAKAVYKGQTVRTVDTPEGRSYEIIINR